MTRIDFYVLAGEGARDRYLTVCRLAEKAYHLGHRLYIQTELAEEETALDDLLWTFRQNSFVPHARWQGSDDPLIPVWVGHRPPPGFLDDVLINLAKPVPDAFDRFARLVEIVDQDEQIRAAGRRRYRFYTERGFAPQTHRLPAAAT